MTPAKRCEYISWRRFYALCARLHGRIHEAGFRPEVIVGIARGGYMPARVLADFFGLMTLTSIKIEHYHGPRKQPTAVVREPLEADIDARRVLVVDDVSDSGDTFDVALGHLRDRGRPAELRTAVMHHKITSRYRPDFCAQRVVRWRWIIYPWAVVEDLGILLDAISPRPRTVPDAQRLLLARHGLRIPGYVLADAAGTLDLLASE